MRILVLLPAVSALLVSAAWGATTQQNRSEMTGMAGVAVTGVHLPTLLTMPVTLALYAGQEILVGIDFGSFQFDSSDIPSDTDETFSGEFSSVGVYLR